MDMKLNAFGPIVPSFIFSGQENLDRSYIIEIEIKKRMRERKNDLKGKEVEGEKGEGLG